MGQGGRVFVVCPALAAWAGLQDNVPSDRPSAKVAPVGCQLATVALKIYIATIPTGGLHGRSCHAIWDVSAPGRELHETGELSATLAVNRLGRCRSCNPALKSTDHSYHWFLLALILQEEDVHTKTVTTTTELLCATGL